MSANEPGQPLAAAVATVTRDLPTPRIALAIGAHPDDVEFGAGATLAKWAADGCIVHHLVCTDGSKGTWDPHADTAALIARRQDEQREAARRIAGDRAGEVVFLGYVDGELDSAALQARSRVARVIRELRPDVVLGHDPWKRYRIHPDHRHAGLLACDGVVAARDPHFFPEHGIAHHRPERILLWEADVVHHVEDVTGWVDHKLAALEAHVSQFESTMKAIDASQLGSFRTRIRDRLAGHAAAHPVAGVPIAAMEVFAMIDDL
jgi:LmbE family N-acetylglucosaminyl deacetylase